VARSRHVYLLIGSPPQLECARELVLALPKSANGTLHTSGEQTVEAFDQENNSLENQEQSHPVREAVTTMVVRT
jgi:hypothetical protein